MVQLVLTGRRTKIIKNILVRPEVRLFTSDSLSAFYGHVNHKLDNNRRILLIQSANGTVLATDTYKVNTFNDHFTSVFTQPICSFDKCNIQRTCVSEEFDFSQQAVFET